jgi:hypothetical protein
MPNENSINMRKNKTYRIVDCGYAESSSMGLVDPWASALLPAAL